MAIMKNLIILVLTLASLSSFSASDRPKLVVGIVVDQMRWDYLVRFGDRYSKDGFKRLIKNGFSFDNCQINYIPAYTAIGHSTIYSGSVPSIHGISGNDFIEQSTGRPVYCTEDKNVKGVGSINPEDNAGKMSPLNLKATTITDQLKYASNFRSKVIGVALKDRGSILPGGHAADAAYWFDTKSGNWISSSWYMQKLPAWLEEYNSKKMPEAYLKKDWHPLYPVASYKQSPSNGTGKFENGFKELATPALPLKTSELMKSEGVGLIAFTPFGNTTTFDIAKLALKNENLGQGKETDFLAISLSSPDKIAHHFSINSIFVEDNYLRLDKELGEFLAYLDKSVGAGKYLVFLTADHGGTPNASFMKEHKIPASVWMPNDQKAKLNDHLKEKFGKENLVISLMNYQVHFNNKLITSTDLDIEKIKLESIKYLEAQNGVSYAVDMKKVQAATIPSVIKEKIINGYNREFSGEVQIIVKPGWYEFEFRDPNKGGTHGVWSPDDAHIPFVLFGWGIRPGNSMQEVYMTDIAPTLSGLLKIQSPNGSIGKIVYPTIHQ